jgi:hypothetical protein
VVKVGTTPPPSSVPGVAPGSTWEALDPSCPRPIPPDIEELTGWPPSSFVETYDADGTLAASSTFPGNGYYTVKRSRLTESLVISQGPDTMFLPIDDNISFTWNPSAQDYTGTDSFDCSWTLVPAGS